jgi:phosphoglycerate kinase
MKLKTIKQIKNLKNKRVLLRVDFNVPLKNGKIIDDSRIKSSFPTIEYLIKKGAKVILVSHLGRPVGVDKKLSLEPVAQKLAELIKKEVFFTDLVNLSAVTKLPKLTLLENIRFYKDEAEDKNNFSKKLAELADIFVLDGFAVAHRDSGSVTGLVKHLPAFAGLLLEKEIMGLNKVIINPKKPFVVVLGGVKIETKVPVLKALLPKADYVLIGGGIFNTYLKASGYNVGGSLVDRDYFAETLKYCNKMKVIKPVDVVVGTVDGKNFKVMKIDHKFKIADKKYGILDIGPETVRLYAEYIKKARTLIWNGAVGYFEQKPYHHGTLSVARLVASRARGKAYGVIGGGETLQAMEMVKMTEYVDLVSTGGGAMLEFLAGNKLPGLKKLVK